MITLKEELRRIIIVIMEKTSVDTNDVSEDMDVAAMDKECSALSALFQQIINEMKVCNILSDTWILSKKIAFCHIWY